MMIRTVFTIFHALKEGVESFDIIKFLYKEDSRNNHKN